ncbi:hypothetical protein BBBOND_0310480 [Babesia bigemina]|uniref:Uncharacterized protein n=1 Tax=Babesia bigemina TaxID=5866 RepID=A0A061DEE6_BABBI|nr:hypothetical protein BBBOND_0310480 [Babesia bigemina]CDR97145.1 hypothetical protein BBBOND_0310480 [Babesia bigemina]|eukprot:XP_012769331.1 hypothetical protein BBBOND_0310480 [Babesia bigemina]
MGILYLQLVKSFKELRNMDDNAKAAVGSVIGGLALGISVFLLVLYIMGKIYNVSLGEIFGQIRDGFRDSKPKLQ